MRLGFLIDVMCAVLIAIIVVSYLLIVWCVWRRCVQHFNRVEDPELGCQCFICCNHPPDVLLVTCGHGGLCHLCAQRLLGMDRRCPLCRRSVNGVLFVPV